jgi:putative Holliday junction resolvase
MPTTPNPTSVLALDVGAKRVGLAIASLAARLPRPLTTLERGDAFFKKLRDIITEENVSTLIVGLPRGLDGQHTDQTRATEEFVTELRGQVDLPIHLQDEALTSHQAETELQGPQPVKDKGKIDALAATYILEDYLSEHATTEQLESR